MLEGIKCLKTAIILLLSRDLSQLFLTRGGTCRQPCFLKLDRYGEKILFRISSNLNISNFSSFLERQAEK